MDVSFNRRAARRCLTEWVEERSVTQVSSSYFELPPTTKSTISIAFSHDGETFASTHGDHTVKVTCYHTRRVLQTLVGHARTPWTVKYHPSASSILASGCLGGEVRVWDADTGLCLHRADLLDPVTHKPQAIISLSFHPQGDIIAVASGNLLRLWDYTQSKPPFKAFRHKHTLRCVHFPPDGDKIILGCANDAHYKLRSRGDGQQQQKKDVSFELLMWNFDVGDARDGADTAISEPYWRILNRALLYNDGGFDVSACGRFMCACAELPEVSVADRRVRRRSNLPQPGAETTMAVDEDRGQRFSRSAGGGDNDDDDEGERKLRELCVGNRGAAWPAFPAGAECPSSDGMREYRARQQATASAPWVNDDSAVMSPPVMRRSRALERGSGTDGDDEVSSDTTRSAAGRGGFRRLHQYPVSTPAAATAQQQPAGSSPLTRRRRTDSSEARERTRYIAHLVVVSLEVDLGKILHSTPLEGARASGVTCVKFSPSSAFTLLGYGVRDNTTTAASTRDALHSVLHPNDGPPQHQVATVYRTSDMRLMLNLRSADDDVNIARFHPESGNGFVYGTKQGRLRVMLMDREPSCCPSIDGQRGI